MCKLVGMLIGTLTLMFGLITRQDRYVFLGAYLSMVGHVIKQWPVVLFRRRLLREALQQVAKIAEENGLLDREVTVIINEAWTRVFVTEGEHLKFRIVTDHGLNMTQRQERLLRDIYMTLGKFRVTVSRRDNQYVVTVCDTYQYYACCNKTDYHYKGCSCPEEEKYFHHITEQVRIKLGPIRYLLPNKDKYTYKDIQLKLLDTRVGVDLFLDPLGSDNQLDIRLGTTDQLFVNVGRPFSQKSTFTYSSNVVENTIVEYAYCVDYD